MGNGRKMKADNIYTRCRLEAAEYDDRLLTRERASEELGCSNSVLSDYELGIRVPQPYMVMRMVDRYRAPELLCYYCSNECVLGKDRYVFPEFSNLDRVTIKLVNALKQSNDISDVILDVAEDGKITANESRKMEMVTKAIDSIIKAANALQLFIAKANLKNNTTK